MARVCARSSLLSLLAEISGTGSHSIWSLGGGDKSSADPLSWSLAFVVIKTPARCTLILVGCAVLGRADAGRIPVRGTGTAAVG